MRLRGDPKQKDRVLPPGLAGGLIGCAATFAVMFAFRNMLPESQIPDSPLNTNEGSGEPGSEAHMQPNGKRLPAPGPPPPCSIMTCTTSPKQLLAGTLQYCGPWQEARRKRWGKDGKPQDIHFTICRPIFKTARMRGSLGALPVWGGDPPPQPAAELNLCDDRTRGGGLLLCIAVFLLPRLTHRPTHH
eukprot:jgi/Botrbrau1/9036/Bobra.0376s0013.1